MSSTAANYPAAMATLVELSRHYGSDPAFVLAGGGNTSLKEGDRMWVKGSGQPLGEATPEGFVEMDRKQLDALLAAKLSEVREVREQQFKDASLKARVHPELGQRPSVEVVVHHTVPGKFVVHTHCTIVNMLSCAVEGQKITRELFGDRVLWIPYVDPGYVLARTIADALAAYKKQTGKAAPEAMFMQNHGLIVSGDTAEEIHARSRMVVETLARRIQPGRAPLGEWKAGERASADVLVKRIAPLLRGLLAENPATLPVVCFDDDDLALSVAAAARGREAALIGPMIPDQIVYSGVLPLWVKIDAGADDRAILGVLRGALEAHRQAENETPRIVIVEGLGIFSVATDAKSLATTRELYRDAIHIMGGAASVGGILPIGLDQRRFIQNWEVEAYRKALAARSAAAAGRMKNKVCLVTGAAQGFGLEIAQGLAAEGACVILADVNSDGVQREAVSIVAKYGVGRAIGVAMNVTDAAGIEHALGETVRRFGGLDLLVSNAGVLRAGSVKTQSEKDFDFVTSVNYKGYFLCVKHASPMMARQHLACAAYRSDIIQINSKSGLQGSNRNGAYAGSKFGGIGLTQSFALELVEDGIKVNSVCPGNFFDGPLWSDPNTGLFVQYLRSGKVPGATTIADVKHAYESKVPMGRGCTTADVLKAIFYLVEQHYETGQALPVTGGQVMLA